MNNKKIYKTLTERGGLMIEALAMLGLIAVVTPTMYKKSAERTLEVEDINTAGAMRTYIGAVDAYIAANYSNLMDKDIHVSDYITISNADLAAYLPYNFQAGSLYEFGEPVAKVYRRSNNLTAFVVYPAKSDAAKGIGQERTARIAALVGSNGGYITDTSGGVKARGIGGIWKLEGENYTNVFGGTAAAAPNKYSIVISSSNVVNGENLGEEGEQTKFLQRTKENGENQEWRNTMRTDLYMGGNQNTSTGLDDDGDETKSQTKYSIRNINSLIVGAEKVTDGEGNEMDYGLFINKTGTNPNAFIGGTLEAAFNEANNKARFLVSDGNINMNEHVKTDNISGLYSTAPGEITVSVDGKVRVNEELIAKQVDTGKVRATELAVGSDKIDSGEKWLNVDTSGVQISEPDVDEGKVKFIASSEQIKLTTDDANSGDSPTGGAEILMSGKGVNPKDNASILMSARDVYAKVTAGKNNDEISEIDSGRFTVGKESSDVLVVDVKSGTTTNPSYSSNKWKLSKYPADSGTVFVRKGMLAVTGGEATARDAAHNNKPDSDNDADDGTGIVMANRFVANNLDNSGNLVKVPNLFNHSNPTAYGNSKTVYEIYNGNSSNRYDTYMVNPAYTSVMNDIKLTTRGGARLSDILPDFITKGIYVATNDKPETHSLTFSADDLTEQQRLGSLGKADDGSLHSDDNYASPFTGVVPAPPCPPGYSRVITVTPSSFQMAQAGSLNLSNTNKPYVENKNLANAPSTLVEPEYYALGLKSQDSGTISGGNITIEDVTPPISNKKVSINNATLADNMMKLSHNNNDVYVLSADQVDGKHQLKPLVFQQSTWLKSLVVPIKTSGNSSYGSVPDGYTRGWAVLMGFLYPAGEYTNFTKTLNIDSSSNAYWNIFPVKKYTLEGYATTYCYFDRDNKWRDFEDGYNSYVDKYDVFENTTGYEAHNKKYRQNLNDPSLKYDELW